MLLLLLLLLLLSLLLLLLFMVSGVGGRGTVGGGADVAFMAAVGARDVKLHLQCPTWALNSKTNKSSCIYRN